MRTNHSYRQRGMRRYHPTVEINARNICASLSGALWSGAFRLIYLCIYIILCGVEWPQRNHSTFGGMCNEESEQQETKTIRFQFQLYTFYMYLSIVQMYYSFYLPRCSSQYFKRVCIWFVNFNDSFPIRRTVASLLWRPIFSVIIQNFRNARNSIKEMWNIVEMDLAVRCYLDVINRGLACCNVLYVNARRSLIRIIIITQSYNT